MLDVVDVVDVRRCEMTVMSLILYVESIGMDIR